MRDSTDIVKILRSKWGTKTLDDFRRESERHPEGGIFEAIRAPDGRRVVIVFCVTQSDDISLFEKTFTLIDDGVGEDWKAATLLDLFMASSNGSGSSFSCTRDKPDGRRSALVFLAHTPDSCANVERLLCLPR